MLNGKFRFSAKCEKHLLSLNKRKFCVPNQGKLRTLTALFPSPILLWANTYLHQHFHRRRACFESCCTQMQLELLRIMVLMCGRIHLFVLYFPENVQYSSLVVSLNKARNQKIIHNPLVFRRIFGIKQLPLSVLSLAWGRVSNLFNGRGRFGRRREIDFFPLPSRPTAKNPGTRLLGTLETNAKRSISTILRDNRRL